MKLSWDSCLAVSVPPHRSWGRTGAGAGVDSVCGQEKLEARKKLEKVGGSRLSIERIVGLRYLQSPQLSKPSRQLYLYFIPLIYLDIGFSWNISTILQTLDEKFYR